jgi:hypothetical protein
MPKNTVDNTLILDTLTQEYCANFDLEDTFHVCREDVRVVLSSIP